MQHSRFVPCLFLDGQYFGGIDEVTKLDLTNRLAGLLRKKGLQVARRRQRRLLRQQ